MKKYKISIVVPVYNEEKMIAECLANLMKIEYERCDFEIVVVNDGSTDETMQVIKKQSMNAEKKGVDLKICNLEENLGRVIAREEGAKIARYDHLLFIDARCMADKNILNSINRLNYQPIIGNPIVDPDRSILDRFVWLRARKMYKKEFSNEGLKPTYINKDNFDKIGKGLGMFFCKKELFLNSQLIEKNKDVSDDIRLFKNIIKTKDILRHPDVKVYYVNRDSLFNEMVHTFERGPKFVDYYLDYHKKNFWIFIFMPFFLITAFLVLAFFDYRFILYEFLFLVSALVVIAIWMSARVKDFFLILFLFPLMALSFELGIARGVILKTLKRY